MGDTYFTTTGYGSWATEGDRSNVSVEASIADAVNGGDRDWRERMEAAGAFEKIADAYRAAINEALPERVSLIGNEFIGPAYEDDHTWEEELDIPAVVKGVDLMEIVERHDVDTTKEQ